MRGFAKIAVAVAAMVLPVVLFAAPAQAQGDGVTPQYVPCGSPAPADKDNVSVTGGEAGTNIRNGSSVSCPSKGQLQPSHRLDFYCRTSGAGSDYGWTYLRDVNTGVHGWVRDDLLPMVNGVRGSIVWC